jgi:dynamin family protein
VTGGDGTRAAGTAESLHDRVRQLCGEAADRLPAGPAALVREAAAALGEPLRIAFVGRVSSGKSTMVNGYLGRLLAPTDEGECTKVVTSIRFGPADRAQARLHDGSVLPLPLDPGGPLPSKLGAEVDEVRSIEVELSLEALRDTTIIDTPGLNSAHDENSSRTREELGIDQESQAAAATADAVLFILNATAHDDERAVLRQFRGVSLGLHAAPSNAIGLLTKADEVSMDEDPWPAAVDLAAKHSRQLGRDVATVLPVVGLLAETAEARFTQADADAIRALAALGPADREVMLLGPDYFTGLDSAVGPAQRERLYAMLRPFGLRRLLRAADAGASGPAMVDELRQCSGMAAVRSGIDRRFRARAAALKAAKVLAALAASAGSPEVDHATRAWVTGAIDDLGLDPVMHGLEELRALSLVSSGAALLPGAQLGEAERLLTETESGRRLGLPDADRDALLTAAREGLTRWTTIANTAISPRARDLARVIIRTLDLECDRLGGDQP